MQIIIPMSGFGERFRAAGYTIPKPLIEVNGKAIIQHVTELFPGDHEFIFICNSDHLRTEEFRMREILEGIGRSYKIVEIEPHKLGPVHAILEARQHMDTGAETIVNYADFTCRWSFQAFLDFVHARDLDGCVPAYRGFHPHSGGTTNYAYIREKGLLVQQIREKQPFTEDKTAEFASTGTYYFKNAGLMLEYLEKQTSLSIAVNGEFYVSSAFDLMARDQLAVGLFPVEHFMQWGTPQDLEEYKYWSSLFLDLLDQPEGSRAIPNIGTSIFLASGIGSRFSRAGYKTPKPNLKISGRSVLSHCLDQAEDSATRLVTTVASSGQLEIPHNSANVSLVTIENLTGGQAVSASLAVGRLPRELDGPVTIFPTDALFRDAVGPSASRSSRDRRLTVWAVKPNPFAKANPESFGWVWNEGDEVRCALKSPPENREALMITGAFTFSNKEIFSELFDRLIAGEVRVNGEFYLDSMICVSEELNIQVDIFCPTIAISFGTPYEFETFRYWQSCFDRWASHPYKLELDPLLQKELLASVREELRATAHSPEEWDHQ